VNIISKNMAGKVIISSNPIKTSERIDINGNVIDPRTKQILVPKESDSMAGTVAQPTVQPVAVPQEIPVVPVAIGAPKDDGLSVLGQIEEAKKRLKELEELKKIKIAQKKKELELLEQ
jgi:phosphoribosylcarboxyaminoimidazole (NCAIR) mutase